MKTCTVDGCTRRHVARGMCSTHYNRTRYTAEQRHPKMLVVCDWCGKEHPAATRSSPRYGGKFCTLACRDAWRSWANGTNECHLTERHPAHPDYVPPLPVLWRKPGTEESRPARRWVAGTCARCATPFVAEDYTKTARYCSLSCARRVGKHRYRARKRHAYVADVSPAAIYQRDRWRCMLCRRPVKRGALPPHPLAPVIDHVVPLAVGGTHEPANVQCAHFRCNSVKRDRGGGEQLALIG